MSSKNHNHNFKILISSFFVGLIFAFGLALGGMLNPNKVLGFLDVFGNWDPSLLMVMVGAISIHMTSFYFIKKRHSPFWVSEFHIPTKKDITPQLIIGSVLFGIGWGIAGFCPGPALASIASGQSRVLVFILSMAAGIWFYKKIENKIPLKK